MSPFRALLPLLLLAACQGRPLPDPGAEKEKMLQADRDFSALSRDSGSRVAFLRYLDTAGILLRPAHFPIVGPRAFAYLDSHPDGNYRLTWIPTSGSVASSGDLGFSYGVYSLLDLKTDSTVQGTYVSVWKKQADGSWKYLLDSGNPGVGP